MIKRDYWEHFHRHVLDTFFGGYSFHVTDTYSDISDLSKLKRGRNGLVIKILGDVWVLKELDDLVEITDKELFTNTDMLGTSTNNSEVVRDLKKGIRDGTLPKSYDFSSPFELTNQEGFNFQTILEIKGYDFLRYEKICLNNISVYIPHDSHSHTRFCDVYALGKGRKERNVKEASFGFFKVHPV